MTEYERKMWLEEHGREEKDVLICYEVDREYILIEDEEGRLEKIFLPESYPQHVDKKVL